jgi:hypothetical protein
MRRSYYQQHDIRRRTFLRLQRGFKKHKLLLKLFALLQHCSGSPNN